MTSTRTGQLLTLALIIALLVNAAINCLVAYEAHQANMNSSDNNRMLRVRCGEAAR